MLGIEVGQALNNVVCLGAHCDDIEIGTAGTLLRLAEAHPEISFHFVVFVSTPERRAEATESAHDLLGHRVTVTVGEFDDGVLPYQAPAAAKDFLRSSIGDAEVDLVFTHHRHDLHQDHRFVADLTGQVFRDHLILEYEILKTDGDLVRPNLYVALPERIASAKLDHLCDHFPSQQKKRWYERETLAALMRIRAVECAAPEGFAEGYASRKMVLG